MAEPDVKILVGALGGASPDGHSAVLIRKQLNDALRKSKGITLNLNVDQQAVITSITNILKSKTFDINVKPVVNNPTQKGGGGGGSKNELAELARVKSEWVKAETQLKKTPKNLSGTFTKELDGIRKRVVDLRNEYQSLLTKYANKKNLGVGSVDDKVNKEKNVSKALYDQQQAINKANDKYDAQIKKLTELIDKAKQYKLEMSNMGVDTQALPEYQAAEQKVDSFITNAEQFTSTSQFSSSDFADQLLMIDRMSGEYSKAAKAVKDLNAAEEKRASEIDKSAQKQQSESMGLKALTAQAQEFYKTLKDNGGDARAPDIMKRFEDLIEAGKSGNYKGTVKDFKKELSELKVEAYAAGLESENLGHKIARVFSEKIGYGVMAAAAAKLRRSLYEIYENVVKIDTAMTELKKVTDETDATYSKFLDNAAKRAERLGAVLSDVISATADFARLGYSLNDASSLADVAVVYKNVGDGIENIGDASESIISTMKAFGIAAGDAMSIVDKYNEVGNNFAISSSGIGEALTRSSAAMAAANNDLDETIALATAANSVVQNPEVVGTSLKTLSMYLRASKTDAEEAGESTEGMADSVSKLRSELLALTDRRVDIMKDDKTYKNTYQILKELSQVWKDLPDVTQANITALIGGKRNANIVSAILSNFDIAEEALKSSQESAGSALRENDKYLESINGKIEQLKSSFQELSYRILDNSFVTDIIDMLKAVIDALNKFDEKTNGLSTNILLIASSFIVLKSALSAIGSTKIFAGIVKEIKGVATAASVASGAAAGLGAVLKGISMSTWIGALATTAFVAIKFVQKWRDEHGKTIEGLKKQADEARAALDEINSSIDENEARIKELSELKEPTFVDEEELRRLKLKNDLLKEQQKILESKSEEADYVSEQAKAKDLLKDTKIKNGVEVSANFKEIEDNIDKIEEYDKLIEHFKSQGDNERVDLYERAKSEITKSTGELLSTMTEEMKDFTGSSEESKLAIDKLIDAYVHYNNAIGSTDVSSTINKLYEKTPYEELRKQLDAIRKEGKLTGQYLLDLFHGADGAVLRQFISEMEEAAGIEFNDSIDSFDALIEVLYGVDDIANDISSDFSTLAENAGSLSEKFEFIKDVKEEMSNYGHLTMKTLQQIEKNWPDMKDTVGEFLSGLTTEEDLIKALSDAYEVDVKNYEARCKANIETNSRFYSNLTKDQKSLIDDLGKSYGVDYDNFKTVEEAKLKLQAEIIKKLAANYSKYTGASLEQLYAARSRLQSTIAYGSTDPEAAGYSFAAETREITQLNLTIAELERTQKALDSIIPETKPWNGSSYKNESSSGSSKSDSFKQGLENELKKLKHLLEMEKITYEQYYSGVAEIRNRYIANAYRDEDGYREEILDLEEEIFNGRLTILQDFVNDYDHIIEKLTANGQILQAKDDYEKVLKRIEQEMQWAINNGLDKNGDFMQELEKQWKTTAKNIVDMIQGVYDEFESYADDFEMWDKLPFSKDDFYDSDISKIKNYYAAGLLGEAEYVRMSNEIQKKRFDYHNDSLNEIIDLTIEMIEKESDDIVDAIDEEIDAYDKLIERKKKLLQDTSDEADHEEEIADAVKEIAKLQSKISQLSLDDSRSAAAKKAELEEQLAEKQKELDKTQRDYALSQTMEALDESQDAFEKEKEAEKKAAEKSIETWMQKYEKAIDMLENDTEGTYKKLLEYADKYSTSIDGPDSIRTAWEAVLDVMKECGTFQNAASFIRDGENYGINPDIDGTISRDIIGEKYGVWVANKNNTSPAGVKTGDLVITGGGIYKKNQPGQESPLVETLTDYIGKPTTQNYADVEKAYAEYLRKHGLVYHNGGVVGRGTSQDNETVALLQKGEIVLDSKKKKALQDMLTQVGQMATYAAAVKASGRANTSYSTVGDTFAPHVEININHSGTLTANDAKHYGSVAADAALEKLRTAFNRRGL